VANAVANAPDPFVADLLAKRLDAHRAARAADNVVSLAEERERRGRG
jgi:hypothetical protein